MSAQFGKRCIQFGRCLASENGFRLYAVALQQIERHEKLPPRGMQRERSQETRNAIGDAGMAW